MNCEAETRESLPSDIVAIEKLYPAAFPDEDLLPLVKDLLHEETGCLSLVAVSDEALLGHGVFTTCGIAGRPERVALLGPLAVAPSSQRQGVGSAIVRAGLKKLRTADTAEVFVLGDPAYYNRFGFEPNNEIAPPYVLPMEWRGAWQSLNLLENGPPLSGQLSVPNPWRQRALWAP